MRCCLCSEFVRRGPDRFELVLDEKGGPKVSLFWHIGCAEIDQLHLAFADAVRTPSTEENDDRVARAYLAILDRIAGEVGAGGLRACVDVSRDIPSRRETMRGAGLAWGRRSPR